MPGKVWESSQNYSMCVVKMLKNQATFTKELCFFKRKRGKFLHKVGESLMYANKKTRRRVGMNPFPPPPLMNWKNPSRDQSAHNLTLEIPHSLLEQNAAEKKRKIS